MDRVALVFFSKECFVCLVVAIVRVFERTKVPPPPPPLYCTGPRPPPFHRANLKTPIVYPLPLLLDSSPYLSEEELCVSLLDPAPPLQNMASLFVPSSRLMFVVRPPLPFSFCV